MVNLKIKATRSDGATFTYNSDTSNIWRTTKLDGIDAPNIEIFKENRGFGNGSIITNLRKEAREAKITSRLYNVKYKVSERKKAVDFHNSNYTYDVEFTYMGVVRKLKECRLQSFYCPTANVYSNPELTVEFLSPYSVLFADFDTSKSLVEITPKWYCDRVYYLDSVNIYDTEVVTTEANIYYDGSEPTPLYITITATGLTTENFEIDVNGNVLTIEDGGLIAGDILIVDLENYDIYLNGVLLSPSLYNYEIIEDMLLQYGDNTVEISSGTNLFFETEIKYTGRYDGV